MPFRIPALALLAPIASILILVYFTWECTQAIMTMQATALKNEDLARTNLKSFTAFVNETAPLLDTLPQVAVAAIGAILNETIESSFAAASSMNESSGAKAELLLGAGMLQQGAAQTEEMQKNSAKAGVDSTQLTALSSQVQGASGQLQKGTDMIEQNDPLAALQVIIMKNVMVQLNVTLTDHINRVLASPVGGSGKTPKEILADVPAFEAHILSYLDVSKRMFKKSFNYAFTSLMVALPVAIGIVVRMVYAFETKLEQVSLGLVTSSNERALLQKVPITKATAIVGLQLGSALFCYGLCTMFVFILCMVFSEPFVADMFASKSFWEKIGTMVLIVAIKTGILDQYLGRKKLAQNNFVVYRVLFSWYATAMLFVDLVKGLVGAAGRLVMVLGIAVFSVGSLDTTVFPERFKALDAGNTGMCRYLFLSFFLTFVWTLMLCRLCCVSVRVNDFSPPKQPNLERVFRALQ